MNKSLEALEKLKDEIIPDYALEYEDDEGYKDWVIELYLTIKQDLERLEQLEKENQDFRYIFQAIKALGELRLEKQVNGEFTYYAIVIGDFCILIEEEQYELLKEVIKNGRDNKISD